MTNPVILLGTQSNGETLPVQVDATGRLVAEGLPGSEGPPGPPGTPGADGGSFPLPPDPYEGALLGWLNGGLAWIGTPPVPIPDDVFGPITAWDSTNGVLTVEGEIPDGIDTGVYIWQVDQVGNRYSFGWNVSKQWTAGATGTPYRPEDSIEQAFNGSTVYTDGHAFAGSSQTLTVFPDLPVDTAVELTVLNVTDGASYGMRLNGSLWMPATEGYQDKVVASSSQLGGHLHKIELINNSLSGPYLTAVRVDNQLLVDKDLSINMRVAQVVGNQIIGSINIDDPGFLVGQYLRTFDQRVAPWVLYGNDPTSLIDHLRQNRD